MFHHRLLLFMVVGCILMLFVVPEFPPLPLLAQEAAAVAEEDRGEVAQVAEEDELDEKWCIFESDVLDVYYPRSRRVYLEGIGLIAMAKRVYGELVVKESRFRKKVLIVVYDLDTLSGDSGGDLVPGSARTLELGEMGLPDEVILVSLTLWGVNEEVLRHEMLHALLLSNGIVPQRWLNEGLAYYHQRQDGFIERWFELLETTGCVPLAELPDSTESAAEQILEQRRQASGWAIVYYLRCIEGKSLKEVLEQARDKTLPEPQSAFAAIQKYRAAVIREEARSAAALQEAALECRIAR